MDSNVVVAAETLPATLEAVSHFVAGIESSFDTLDVSDRTGITLALQELLVNIVVHAYAHLPGDIRVNIQMNDAMVNAVVEDDGPNAYDPERLPKAPDPLDLQEHGMGMFIIQQTFDDVSYARLNTVNHWHLSKRIGASR
ncbi:MAG: ATP-binding protein [Chloroflexota bacterium]|nr:ATP-binding protein [Chloroflexota bacterium]